ncbi:hypothetical protein B9Z19DRAFT_1085124 [Tuber borchii]|uniref:Uncharacterized protein n=1 Tax=Tuber borchii TaxID=42251 RepID=A0A2T6ZR37_TUBBO|nr:hypothetical protein B9Z19DRAFT_1085124 [Tuber borchii]
MFKNISFKALYIVLYINSPLRLASFLLSISQPYSADFSPCFFRCGCFCEPNLNRTGLRAWKH